MFNQPSCQLQPLHVCRLQLLLKQQLCRLQRRQQQHGEHASPRGRRCRPCRAAPPAGDSAQQPAPPDNPAQQQPMSRVPGFSRGLYLRYKCPFDVWLFIQVTAAIWVVNQSIPVGVLSAAAHLQGLPDLAQLPLAEKEVLGLGCQVVQLAATAGIIWGALLRGSSQQSQPPLPPPWFLVDFGVTPVLQAFATAVAAVGSGVLLSGVLTGSVDGAEEWRHLAGMHADRSGVVALVLGALFFAPLTESLYFQGFFLPGLTKWVHPWLAVPLSGLLFASAHPADAFPAEALLGTVLSLSLIAADGNLAVPLLAHVMYNATVLGTEFLL